MNSARRQRSVEANSERDWDESRRNSAVPRVVIAGLEVKLQTCIAESRRKSKTRIESAGAIGPRRDRTRSQQAVGVAGEPPPVVDRDTGGTCRHGNRRRVD